MDEAQTPVAVPPTAQTPEERFYAAIERVEAAAARAEAAAERASHAARGPVPAVNPDGSINTVTCSACGHVGAPMPDSSCPNNNCPTRA